MEIVKPFYRFLYNDKKNVITLSNKDGRRYMDIPAAAVLCVNGKETAFIPYKSDLSGDTFSVYSHGEDNVGEMKLSFFMEDDNIEVSFTAEAKKDFAHDYTELFRTGRFGLYMVDCIYYFTPAPRNFEGINRGFYKTFPDCGSDGYFTPPPLNFCIGNKSGYLAFGLLDLPDSYEFKLTDKLGILTEKTGGKITTKAGETYKSPRLMISFPKGEWESITLFRDLLLRKGIISDIGITKKPAWWHNPMIVSYGDQMMELQYNWYSDADWSADGFTQEWLDMWLDRAEEKLGIKDFTVMVDAFWQHRYSAEAKPYPPRFKDLRKFIDKCHSRGHHVLLWSAPLVDNPENGFETLSQKMGVLSPDVVDHPLGDNSRHIDFTSDKIDDYFAELSRRFFSDDEDALNCDGLKMDFLFLIRNPKDNVSYQNVSNGLGVKEAYRFYKKFKEAACKVKPDVLLNGSACDPRFESIIDMNRLHDIQNVYEERQMRAKVSVLACPDLLVDSDGAIMLSEWVEETYIKAVLYSTPSLYYVNMFHDGVSFDDEKMKSLGKLLWLSGQKTEGRVVPCDNDEWSIVTDGRVTAQTFEKDSLFVYDGKDTMYIFSWADKQLEIPLYDFKFDSLPDGCKISGDKLLVQTKSGKLITLKTK